MLLTKEFLPSEVQSICTFSSSPVGELDAIKTIQDPETTSTQPEVVAHEDSKVTFVPPLHDARRAWILCILRQEHVNTVLDVGCGEGSLLGCLCNAPSFLVADEGGGTFPTYSSACDDLPDLHIARIVGLDIWKRDLKECIELTEPPNDSKHRCLPRWEPLEVKIWLGSLDVFNEEFVGVECIVSTEVIEHLEPSVLFAFAPTLLGLYRPRLLLITTPNYSFNARFSAPGTVDPMGIRDPTRRTNRVFRHFDHKFEWTPSEFHEYCSAAADTWGYSVEVDAIGLPNEPDPWGRDAELGRASQVALFRRLDDWKGPRPPLPTKLEEPKHELLKTHYHPPHEQAGSPMSLESVRERVQDFMESYYFDNGYSIWSLWVESSISIACGGRLDILLRAIESSPDLTLSSTEGVPARDWIVKFAGEKHQAAIEATKKANAWPTDPPEYWGTPSPQGYDLWHEVSSTATELLASWPQSDNDWSEGTTCSEKDTELAWGIEKVGDSEQSNWGGWAE